MRDLTLELFDEAMEELIIREGTLTENGMFFTSEAGLRRVIKGSLGYEGKAADGLVSYCRGRGMILGECSTKPLDC